MFDDDVFIVVTHEHWMFGRDNTGNVMSPVNFRYYIDTVKRRLDPLHLVTADGSIDCSSSPNEQELVVHQLHFTEVVLALCTLAPGGSFVLKLFTMFEPCTANLLFLLGSHFDKLSVTKPATSKLGNSEVYVVANGFRGIDDAIKERLIALVESPPEAWVFGCSADARQHTLALIPRDFLDAPEFWQQHTECATKFSSWQIQAIERNLALDERMSSADRARVQAIKNEQRAKYLHRTRLQPISPTLHIVNRTVGASKYTQPLTGALNSGAAIFGSEYIGTRQSRIGGTLADRQEAKSEHLVFQLGKRSRDQSNNEPTAVEDGSTLAAKRPKKHGQSDGDSRQSPHSNLTLEVDSQLPVSAYHLTHCLSLSHANVSLLFRCKTQPTFHLCVEK